MSDVTVRLATFTAVAVPSTGRSAGRTAAHLSTRLRFSAFEAIGSQEDRDAGARIGGEIAARIEHALGDDVEGGWDPLGAALTVGAAAATARALGLSPQLTAQALSTAATQVSGFSAVTGTPLGDYQERHAVRQGVAAASLVAAGLEAPSNGLEGRRGMFALLAPTASAECALDGLGETWLSEGGTDADG